VSPEGERETPIRRALLSVHDRTGLLELARALSDGGTELWATGGTRRELVEGGCSVRAAEELTGIGSWFGGRIKTLHPGILGGILAPRTEAGRTELAERGLLPFDLVVVNFYPFEQHLRESPDATDREEFIDIGGVTLARASAKNHEYVSVLSDPADYAPFVAEYRARGGAVSGATRRSLAVRAFERCTAYDAAIAFGLTPAERPATRFPDQILLTRDRMPLRYGENPHQPAAVYSASGPAAPGLVPAAVELVKGEGLSYNNLLDVDATLAIVAEYSAPSAAVVKHGTPCGVASAPSIREALELAVATDPVARYGCAVAVNRPLTAADVEPLHGVFVDLLSAPAFDRSALDRLGRRPKVKLLRSNPEDARRTAWEAKSALGHLLLQESDRRQIDPAELKLVTATAASADDRASLDFAWRTVRHAKSNAIVLAAGQRTVGIGSGQPTRVKAVELAVGVAGDRARGSVLASDAFFPFPDGVDIAGRAGVRAIVQPGGSVRDAEVVTTAERYGMAMYFTGWRVFRH